MNTNKIYEITFNKEEIIVTATLSGSDEWVMLMNSGDVISCKMGDSAGQYLFSVTKNNFYYEDGGFDITAPSTIYTLEAIIVVVNDYKRHGFVYHKGMHHAVNLSREDYHADISSYPVALFKDKLNVPHLIYGVAWNHLQIMNMDTLQILTAAKSLIHENAEKDIINFNKEYNQTSNLPWPPEYDYFFGRLEMSPDKNKFLSAGWVWGSGDFYKVYNVEDFINNSRITDKNIDIWEHNNRAVCWIDDYTIAVAYHPYNDGREGATVNSPCEIHFYAIGINEPENKIKTIVVEDLDILTSKFQYSKFFNAIVVFSNVIGMALITLEGQILFKDENFKPVGYYEESNLFLKAEGKTISLYQIS